MENSEEGKSDPVQGLNTKKWASAQKACPGKKLRRNEDNSQDSVKTFQRLWLKDPQFKGWLEAVPNDSTKAKCYCCNAILNSGKSDLQKHAKTEKHEKAVKRLKGYQTINQAFQSASSSSDLAAAKAKESHEIKVKTCELRLAAFFAEHNVALYNSDDLIEVIKTGVNDSAIVKDLTLGRRKCSLLVSKVLAQSKTDDLSEELRKNHFSVLIDESTDISNKKNMCILVRYVSSVTKLPVTTLLELVQVDAHDCSAVKLWDEFKKCLQKHSIPLANVIGLGCDNASVMTSQYNSFFQLLKAECPYAILIRCTCHSSALVSKYAMAVLPSFVVGLLRDISTYMNNSPKRCAELQDFQELYEKEFVKVLKPATTRWLVLHPCVKRYLDLDQCLLGYFRTTVRENPSDKEAKSILEIMQNPYTKAYMLFLDYALNFLNEFNGLFQSREVLIHKISENSRKLLNKLGQNFVHPEELSRLHSVKFSHPSNLLPPEKVYLGPTCSNYLNGLVNEAKKDTAKIKNPALLTEVLKNVETFQLKCRDFYSKAAEEIQSRLPINSDVFREMAFINPAKLLSPQIRVADPKDGGIADLSSLSSHFQEILALDPNALALEWRTIPVEIDGNTRERLLEMPVDRAWVEIFEMKDFNDQPMFPELSKLAKCVLSLPHSNAEAERAFSIVTDVKSKKRNRLGAEHLNAIAVVRTAFASRKVSSSSFKVKPAHLDKFN